MTGVFPSFSFDSLAKCGSRFHRTSRTGVAKSAEALLAPDAQFAFLPKSFTTARAGCCLPESSSAKQITDADAGSLVSDPCRSWGFGLRNAFSRVEVEGNLSRQAGSTAIRKTGQLRATPPGATSCNNPSTKERWKGMRPCFCQQLLCKLLSCRTDPHARVQDKRAGLFPLPGWCGGGSHLDPR